MKLPQTPSTSATENIAEPVSSARIMRLKIDLSDASHWTSESKKDGRQDHRYEWTERQWLHIERTALRLLSQFWDGVAEWNTFEEVIPPEIAELWEDDMPEGLFPANDDLDKSDYLNGAATVIGVAQAIYNQFEEEIAKRDI